MYQDWSLQLNIIMSKLLDIQKYEKMLSKHQKYSDDTELYL